MRGHDYHFNLLRSEMHHYSRRKFLVVVVWIAGWVSVKLDDWIITPANRNIMANGRPSNPT